MANYGHIILFSLLGGVVSLVGGLLLLSRKKVAGSLARYATPFAAGALLAAAFFDLLPEAMELTAEGAATRWVLGGIVAFFLLEHFLHWFHHHHEHPKKQAGQTTATLIIIGDTLHNFLDGIAIGAAFLISVPTGIVAALAVAAHEIPQEIGDFGLLLKQGLSRRKVVMVNVISALMSTLGALLTFRVGSEASLPLGELLAITAGMFIYIAASDLIPTIHETVSKKKTAHLPVLLLLVGIAVVGLTTELAHERIEGHGHSDTQKVTAGYDMPDHETLPEIVSLQLRKDLEGGYNLTVETKNFRFSPEAVGQGLKPGEGYGTVYINDRLVTRLYAPTIYLDSAEPGDEIRITLHVNDYREITHDGEAVHGEITVEAEGSYKRYFDVGH